MLGPPRQVRSCQADGTLVEEKSDCHGGEQCCLPRPVSTDDDDERPFLDCQVDALQRPHLAGRIWIERFPKAVQLKHAGNTFANPSEVSRLRLPAISCRSRQSA